MVSVRPMLRGLAAPLRSPPRPRRPLCASTADPLRLFDKEHADLYDHVFPNHFTPGGPFELIACEAARVLPGGEGSVLDICSGPGEPAITIARRMPRARVVSTDISPHFHAKALSRASGLANVEILVADCQALPFESESFDVVTCCYGYMHVEDKDRAFRETARVLRPGGHAIFTHWLRISNMDSSRAMMRAVLGREPPPPALDAHALAAPGVVDDLLTRAGLRFVRAAEAEYDIVYDGEGDAFRVAAMPVEVQLEAHARATGRADVYDAAAAAFHAFVEARGLRRADGRVAMPDNRFRMVVATRGDKGRAARAGG